MYTIYLRKRALLKSLFVVGLLLGANMLFSQPVINSFSPAAGATGTTVTITGSNFSTTPANNTVYFGYAKANVVSATATTLMVTVPASATYEPISVTTDNLTAWSQLPFNVTFPGIGANFAANSFSAGIVFGTEGYYDVITGDVDGDGKNDVVTANYNNSFSVFRNTSTNGMVSFAPKVDYYPMGSPYSITLADFNGDGKLDIATGWGSTLSVYKNNSTPGAISFASAADLFISNTFYNLIATDLNGDGKPDLAIADEVGLSIMKNTSTSGNISFYPDSYITAGYWAHSIAAGDLDGDGRPDLVIGLNVSQSNSNGKISIFKNTTMPGGNLSLAPQIDLLTGGNTGFGVKIADFDGDGKPDIVASNNSSANIAVFKNTSIPDTISLAPKTNYSTGAGPGLLSVDDLDGDGKADIIAPAGTKMGLLKNTSTAGAISLANLVEYNNTNTARNSSTGDLDGDGKPELIIANYPQQGFTIYRNQIGDPSITPSGSSPVTGNIMISSTVDASVQSYNDAPYIQRHYEIEPDNNAASATATITLYFTQQDFDNFNATAGHGANLPASPTDAAAKANLRIFQYHGTSTTGTPGSYTGSAVTIDPDDNNIIWNAATQWWAVTFDVNGFSGFFAGNVSAPLIPLPVTLLDFNGTPVDNNTELKWKVENEEAFDHYEIEYSSDNAGHYTVIGKVYPGDHSQAAAVYTFTHKNAAGFGSTGYYRLKLIDANGSYKQSKIVKVQFTKTIVLNVTPTLIKRGETIRINVTGNSTNPYKVIISNMAGQVIDSRSMIGNNLHLETGKLQTGTYSIKVEGEGMKRTVKVIVQ
jgi:hypothetical protein